MKEVEEGERYKYLRIIIIADVGRRRENKEKLQNEGKMLGNSGN